MWHLATAHAQTLHFRWAYNRVKTPLCKNFEAKEGMGVYSRWAYFREGTVYCITRMFCEHQTFANFARVDQFAKIKSAKPKL